MTTPPTTHPRTLVALGAAAGPLYLGVAAAQVVARDGFDLRRHAVSLLANGELGWVQIANFVVTGLLVVAGAAGLRHALRDGPGRVWGPRLLAVYGVCLVLAGVFVADPAEGFPPGASAPPPGTMTASGVGHLVVGGIGFVALVATSLVVARWFSRRSQRGWAAGSAATGLLFLAAFVGIASGPISAARNLTFTAAVVLSWAWLTALLLTARSWMDARSRLSGRMGGAARQ